MLRGVHSIWGVIFRSVSGSWGLAALVVGSHGEMAPFLFVRNRGLQLEGKAKGRES